MFRALASGASHQACDALLLQGRAKARHRIIFFAFDLLHLDSQDLRRTPLMERRAALRKLTEPDPRSPIQFSDHADGYGALFFKHAADLGLEGKSLFKTRTAEEARRSHDLHFCY